VKYCLSAAQEKRIAEMLKELPPWPELSPAVREAIYFAERKREKHPPDLHARHRELFLHFAAQFTEADRAAFGRWYEFQRNYRGHPIASIEK